MSHMCMDLSAKHIIELESEYGTLESAFETLKKSRDRFSVRRFEDG